MPSWPSELVLILECQQFQADPRLPLLLDILPELFCSFLLRHFGSLCFSPFVGILDLCSSHCLYDLFFEGIHTIADRIRRCSIKPPSTFYSHPDL